MKPVYHLEDDGRLSFRGPRPLTYDSNVLTSLLKIGVQVLCALIAQKEDGGAASKSMAGTTRRIALEHIAMAEACLSDALCVLNGLNNSNYASDQHSVVGH